MSSIVLMMALTTAGMTPGHGSASSESVPWCPGYYVPPSSPQSCVPPSYPESPAPTPSPPKPSLPPKKEGADRTPRRPSRMEKAIEDLKKGQAKAHTEGLQREVDALRQKAAEQAIDDLRARLRRVEGERGGERPVLPKPKLLQELPPPRTATVQLQMPAVRGPGRQREAGRFCTPNTWTPSTLEPGKGYYYRFRVTVVREGKSVTRVKNVYRPHGSVVPSPSRTCNRWRTAPALSGPARIQTRPCTRLARFCATRDRVTEVRSGSSPDLGGAAAVVPSPRGAGFSLQRG